MINWVDNREIFRFEVDDLRVLVQKTVEIEGVARIELLEFVLFIFPYYYGVDGSGGNNTETIVEVSGNVAGLNELVGQGVWLLEGETKLFEKFIGEVIVEKRDSF